MSTQAWIILVCHTPLIAWLLWDRFKRVNRWADKIETFFPPWLRWDVQGDKATWVQHGLTAFGASLYGGLLSLLVPESFMFGATFLAWAAFLGYVVRESITLYERRPNEWAQVVDGVMDTIGPLAVAVGWTSL